MLINISMTPERFKELTKYIIICNDELGEYLNPSVAEEIVDKWESGVLPIPDNYAEQIIYLATLIETQIVETVERVSEKPSKTEYLIQYSDDELREFDPENYRRFLGSARLHHLFLWRLNLPLSRAGCNHALVYFNRASYLGWLERNGRSHSQENLQLWAEECHKPMPISELPEEFNQKMDELRGKINFDMPDNSAKFCPNTTQMQIQNIFNRGKVSKGGAIHSDKIFSSGLSPCLKVSRKASEVKDGTERDRGLRRVLPRPWRTKHPPLIRELLHLYERERHFEDELEYFKHIDRGICFKLLITGHTPEEIIQTIVAKSPGAAFYSDAVARSAYAEGIVQAVYSDEKTHCAKALLRAWKAENGIPENEQCLVALGLSKDP